MIYLILRPSRCASSDIVTDGRGFEQSFFFHDTCIAKIVSLV